MKFIFYCYYKNDPLKKVCEFGYCDDDLRTAELSFKAQHPYLEIGHIKEVQNEKTNDPEKA